MSAMSYKRFLDVEMMPYIYKESSGKIIILIIIKTTNVSVGKKTLKALHPSNLILCLV